MSDQIDQIKKKGIRNYDSDSDDSVANPADASIWRDNPGRLVPNPRAEIRTSRHPRLDDWEVWEEPDVFASHPPRAGGAVLGSYRRTDLGEASLGSAASALDSPGVGGAEVSHQSKMGGFDPYRDEILKNQELFDFMRKQPSAKRLAHPNVPKRLGYYYSYGPDRFARLTTEKTHDSRLLKKRIRVALPKSKTRRSFERPQRKARTQRRSWNGADAQFNNEKETRLIGDSRLRNRKMFMDNQNTLRKEISKFRRFPKPKRRKSLTLPHTKAPSKRFKSWG